MRSENFFEIKTAPKVRDLRSGAKFSRFRLKFLLRYREPFYYRAFFILQSHHIKPRAEAVGGDFEAIFAG
jgi:hypothetical protein